MILSAHIHAADLRNSEYDSRVDLAFPPYGRHGSRYGSTDQLADLQFLVYPWESVSITVVVFADHDTGWFQPLVERVASDVLSARNEALIFLSVQEGYQVIMQPATAIVTCIYDDSFFDAVLFAQQFAVYSTETGTVHSFDMYISNTAVGQFVYQLAVSFYPSLVEQVFLLSVADSLDRYIEAFSV